MYNWARSFGLGFVILTKVTRRVPVKAGSPDKLNVSNPIEVFNYQGAYDESLKEDLYEAFEKVAIQHRFRDRYRSLVPKLQPSLNFSVKQLVSFMLCGCKGDEMKLIEDFTPVVQFVPTDEVDGNHKHLIEKGDREELTFRDSLFLGPWDGSNQQQHDPQKQGDTTDEDCESSESEQAVESGEESKEEGGEQLLRSLEKVCDELKVKNDMTESDGEESILNDENDAKFSPIKEVKQ